MAKNHDNLVDSRIDDNERLVAAMEAASLTVEAKLNNEEEIIGQLLAGIEKKTYIQTYFSKQ